MSQIEFTPEEWRPSNHTAISPHTSEGGSRLLTTVVEHFTRDAGADLVTFGLEDVDDLAQYFQLVGLSQEEDYISHDREEAMFASLDFPRCSFISVNNRFPMDDKS
jgi:hypothetical protein